ncbi:MAG: hypothetical protein ACFFDU_06320 [Candidatus Thorarchaeota archaeon]
MTGYRHGSDFTLVSLLLSLLGLGLLPFLLLNPPPSLIIPFKLQLIGTAFAVICILGILAGIFPTHCSRSGKKKIKASTEESPRDFPSTNTGQIQKRGHHPTCDHYSGHVLRIHTRILCAGCTGLVSGAIIALIGTVLFFFGTVRFINPMFIFWLGWFFTAIGLGQHYIYHALHIEHGVARFLVNILFVVGPFLLLATLMQFTDSVIFGTYLLALILYWIFTRILMSRRSHKRICTQCEATNCPLSDV